jgi:hypothetical protein
VIETLKGIPQELPQLRIFGIQLIRATTITASNMVVATQSGRLVVVALAGIRLVVFGGINSINTRDLRCWKWCFSSQGLIRSQVIRES